MDFMLDLTSMIAKSATDAELNRVSLVLNKEDRRVAPQHCKQQCVNLSMKWGLTSNKFVVPPELQMTRRGRKITGHPVFWTRRNNKDGF